MRSVKIPNLDSLLDGQRIGRPDRASDDELRQLGLHFNEATMWLADDAKPIDSVRLFAGLSARAASAWPNLAILNECESTNATLMALAAAGRLADGQAVTTEFQWGGRGRRGRSWISPIARNLAVSVAWEFPGSLADLSGLSLAVGIACADALHTLGLTQVALKWPNDLIVLPSHNGSDGPHASLQSNQYAKLGGILVELQSVPGSTVAVVGVGLNFSGAQLLRSQVQQSLADVAELGPELDRTAVLVGVVNALADYLEQFADTGFAPMVPIWNELHAFTGRRVVVGNPDNLANGQQGVVLGIAATGELRLDTAKGELLVGAGEVSLRPQVLDQGTVGL